jgi:FdhD protein
MNQTYNSSTIKRFSQKKLEVVDDSIIVEQPVSLTVNSKVWLTFMCTPIDLEALAAGFLYNENIIKSIGEIEDIRVCEHQDNVDIWLNRNVDEPTDWRRTSGCTGGYTTAILEEIQPVLPNNLILTPDQVLDLIQTLLQSQDIYRKSGGVHSSALATPAGIIFQTEDVGRHNTLDKIAGRILLEGHRVKDRILLSTGRISSEMLQKAARLKASILISRTSPTSMSVDLATKLGVTLIGYARGHRFNIYTHPERIDF